jgi:site-specific DNA-methyltransferase (adenine-specific)
MIELNKVYNEDCFITISKIEDESLDLVLTDPPYGDGIGYGRKGKEILNNKDESINYKFLDAIFPKMKNDTSLYLFSNHKFVNQIKDYAVSIGYNYRMLCIMVKNNIGMGYGFRNQYEVCLVLEKGKAKYNRKDMSNVWKMKHVKHNDQSHPHQKEYDVLRRILLHSTKEGDVVFDGFMGSFSTALACFKENRRFIGSELDPKWYKLGTRKLDDLTSQNILF